MTTSGPFDKRIRLEAAALIPGDTTDVQGFALLAEVAARQMRQTPEERARAGQEMAISLVRWQIRWSPDVAALNARGRLEHPIGSGRWQDVVGVEEIGRQDLLEITSTVRTDLVA